MKNKKKNKRRIIIMILTFLIIGIFSYYIYNTYENIEINNENYTVSRTESTVDEQTVESVTKYSNTIADVLEETTQEIVGISKLKNTGNSILSKSTESQLGLGTGIIVTDNGYILSNEHVTGSKYSKCYITLENGENYDGTVVWSDKDIDLSITKINAENLPYAKLSDSDKIRVGETVYAIGNPIGFEFRRTVTSGIISAKNRTIKIDEEGNQSYMSGLIQTDATINPGNSGGPLIYPNGEVIGINTVKISSAEGIGFAIPINLIKPIIESYKVNNNFEEASIGIFAYDKEVIPYLSNNNIFQNGIYIAQIIKNSPADNTELREKDIITSVDGIEVNSMNSLRKYIYTKKPDEDIVLKVSRGRVIKEIKIKLGKK